MKKNSIIKLRDLQYFHHRLTCDIEERGSATYKADRWLMMRSKLVSLPNDQFDHIMNIVENLLLHSEGDSKDGVPSPNDIRKLQKK